MAILHSTIWGTVQRGGAAWGVAWWCVMVVRHGGAVWHGGRGAHSGQRRGWFLLRRRMAGEVFCIRNFTFRILGHGFYAFKPAKCIPFSTF